MIFADQYPTFSTLGGAIPPFWGMERVGCFGQCQYMQNEKLRNRKDAKACPDFPRQLPRSCACFTIIAALRRSPTL